MKTGTGFSPRILSRAVHSALRTKSSTSRSLIAGAAVGLGLLGHAQAQQVKDFHRIGFFDASYTRSGDNYRFTDVYGMSGSGYIYGFSEQFNGADSLGNVQWLATTGGVTAQVGMYTGENAFNGAHFNIASQLTSSGYLRGSAARYSGSGGDLGQSAWLAHYDSGTANTVAVGLGLIPAQQVEFTRADGYRYSEATALNEGGVATGFSLRYNNGPTGLGQAAWRATTAGTTKLGFYASHSPSLASNTRADGYQYSIAEFLNEIGTVAGYSQKFGPADIGYIGQVAWAALVADTDAVAVGLYGNDASNPYTGTNGYQFSAVQGLNSAGQMRGYSQRFAQGTGVDLGQSAWFATTAATTRIGLVDAQHTGTNGYQFSEATLLTNAGLSAGYSKRYAAGTGVQLGQSAWAATAGSTMQIGLTSGDFAKADGTQFSNPTAVSSNGNIIGESKRYDAGTGDDRGQGSWVATSGSTARIGLTTNDANNIYTRTDGYQFSVSQKVNSNGLVIGYSSRYSAVGTDYLGQSAWMGSGSGTTGTTAVVGLGHAESSGQFTRNDGFKYSEAQFLTESGRAYGYSQRFNGAASNGEAAWTATASGSVGTTVQIGLSDAIHTGAGQLQNSWVDLVVEGYAAGGSIRYGGGSMAIGETAWVYNVALGSTEKLEFSIGADNHAFSTVEKLLDNGLALGYYRLFDPSTQVDLGNRAFAWLSGLGGFDLGAYVEGGLGSFEYLSNASDGNLQAFITGVGKPAGSPGLAAYVAQVAVPEPSVPALLVTALASAAFFIRRNKKTRSL